MIWVELGPGFVLVLRDSVDLSGCTYTPRDCGSCPRSNTPLCNARGCVCVLLAVGTRAQAVGNIFLFLNYE